MADKSFKLNGGQDFVGNWWDRYLISTDDTVGGNLDNFIFTGIFNDVVNSGAGDDLVYLQGGDDTARGGEGNDRLYGEDGNDKLFGGNGIDYLVGGAGNDILDGEANDDILDGGAGDDDIEGGGGYDILYGGAGNDVLKGEGDNDTFFGGWGINTIIGGTGIDTLALNEGFATDYYTGLLGDQLWGEMYDEYAVADVDLAQSFANIVTMGSHNVLVSNNVFGVENIVGTDEVGSILDTVIEDHLYGNSAANGIQGRAGDDLLDGRGGDDVLKGDDGKDILIGSSGIDTLFGGAHNDTFVFDDGQTGTYVPGVVNGHGAAGGTFTQASGQPPLGVPAGQVLADTIADFEVGDRIDLRAIDANTMLTTNNEGSNGQAFSAFVSNFTAAGQLMIKETLDGCAVYGEVNGDGIADFAIHVVGPHTLGAGDFIL